MPEHTALTAVMTHRRADSGLTNRLLTDIAVGADWVCVSQQCIPAVKREPFEPRTHGLMYIM